MKLNSSSFNSSKYLYNIAFSRILIHLYGNQVNKYYLFTKHNLSAPAEKLNNNANI